MLDHLLGHFGRLQRMRGRVDQADAALALSREVLTRFVAEGPTEAELQAAKAASKNAPAIESIPVDGDAVTDAASETASRLP